METTSLNLSKKLAALNLGVESQWIWFKTANGKYRLAYRFKDGDQDKILFPQAGIIANYSREHHVNAYQLHELLPLLKALSERKGWNMCPAVGKCLYIDCKCTNIKHLITCPQVDATGTYEHRKKYFHPTDFSGFYADTSVKYHFLRIAELYAQSESLEGATEKYIEELL